MRMHSSKSMFNNKLQIPLYSIHAAHLQVDELPHGLGLVHLIAHKRQHVLIGDALGGGGGCKVSKVGLGQHDATTATVASGTPASLQQ